MEKPVFTSESFDGITFVTLSCPTTGASIRYTMDGSDPTESSATYDGVVSIFKTTTFKAVAYASESARSPLSEVTYVVDCYINRDENGIAYLVKNGVSTLLPVPSTIHFCASNCVSVSATGDVYVAGRAYISGAFKPCYWLNGTYHAFSLPEGVVSGNTSYSFTFAGSDAYIQGSTTDASGAERPCYWKNGEYVPLAVYSTYIGGAVGEALMIDGAGSVYVAGSVRLVADIDTPCYWKDGVYTALSLPAGREGHAQSLTFDGSVMYVSGLEYDSSGSSGKDSKPCLWVNGSYSALEAPSLTLAPGSSVCGYRSHNVFVFGSDVYVGGYIYQAGSKWIMSPVYWKNGSIVTLSVPGYTNVSSGVWLFAVRGDSVVPFGSLTCEEGYGRCYWASDGIHYGLFGFQ